MAIILNDNIKINAGKPADAKYLNNVTPYTGTSEVLSVIPIPERHLGLTVNVNGVEYWFDGGTGDNDLVLKSESITNSGGGITGATNGLTKIANNRVVLGGELTGNTVVDALTHDLVLDLGTITTRKSVLRADIGASTDETLLSFRNESGNNVSAGFTDINLGTGNFNSTSEAWGNIAIGQNNLQSIAARGDFSGGRNLAIGFNVGSSLVSGTTVSSGGASNNVLLGRNVLTTACRGQYNVAAGYGAAQNATGSSTSNVFLGLFSGQMICGDISNSVIIGAAAARCSLNIASSSTIIGTNTALMANIIGCDNSLFGSLAGGNSILNGYNTIVGTSAGRFACGAANSTFIGRQAGWSMGGDQNTVVGYQSGRAPNAIGANRGTAFTGTKSTFIGAGATFSSATPSISEVILIGNDFQATEPNKTYLVSKGNVEIQSGHNVADGGLVEFRKSGFYYENDYSATGGTDPRWIPDNGYLTGYTDTIVSLLGGSNGITRVDDNFELGGSLTKATTISGNGQAFDLGTTTSKLQSFDLISSGASNIKAAGDLVIAAQNSNQLVLKSETGSTNGDVFNSGAFGFELDSNNDIFTIVDNRITPRGIEYLANYHNNYSLRSLVDKEYVDNVAAGLDPKSSARYATTPSDGNIDLSGGTFGGAVDGSSVQDNDRVLIKNQNNVTENGIYLYDSANNTFSRTSDFDNSPEGEVTEGALIPIVSGSTNINTLWILITNTSGGFVDLGTTNLNFTLFSQILNIEGGTGVTVTTVGASRNISIDLAANSGLDFNNQSDSGELRIANSFAGLGSTLSAGVLDLNIENATATGTEIRVQIATGGTNQLMVDSADIASAIGSANLLTANNGLTREGNNFRLGGTLTGNTCINTNSFGISIGAYNNSYISANSIILNGGRTFNSNSIAMLYGYTCASDSIAMLSSYTCASNSIAMLNSRTSGSNSIAMSGGRTYGINSIAIGLSNAIGLGSFAAGGARGNSYRINTCGCYSFAFSYNSDNATGNNGANAVQSAILGGEDHDITANARRSIILGGRRNRIDGNNTDAAIIGGNNITLTGNTYIDTTAVSRLAIMNTPLTGTTSDTILVRDSSTGIIRQVSQNAVVSGSISVDNGLSIANDGDIVLGGTLTGNTNINTNCYGFSVGSYSNASGLNSIAFGNANTASGIDSFAIGRFSCAIGNYSITQGYQTKTYGSFSIAQGSCTCAFGIASHSQGISTCAYGVASHAGGRNQGGGFSIIAKGNASFIHSTNDANSSYTNGANSNYSAILGGLNHNIASGNTAAAIIGGTCINLTGTTYIDTTAVSKLAIMDSPSAGASSDTILVRDSSTGIIKQVAGSSLGENNNIYSLTSVTTTTVDSNSYVILVDTSTSSQTVTLPASPADGLAFKIKDKSGNALANNVTIDGGTANIDGQLTAIINTDYGAFELMYSASDSEWYILAFNN